ncbi:cell division protein SepF [Lactobacillus crispatus]|jgi:hypothetical protein|uniref:Cell division protein SepF n=1 Tax=Lactobacillus crispatus TaxID=47770 RepID=A0A135YTQ4_9LACO|nr:cell division protein SepF [Lactobacillus crispatus]KWU10148.1 hypothetical protein AEL98_06200 [Lactobacillus crispatus]KWU14536.1 hypothetical protein AEM00_06875 [Lactobacillus crispatus]KXI12783.1 hypothetical protein HMPREF3209_02111 [Lactobacillus crispatus]NJJ54955.1 cell division protein SepF [Lactobacillus crispatus]TDN28753.1 cell division protein SepF [Lactobacillus crispatus]
MSFLDKLVNTNLDENVGPKSKEYSRTEPEDTPRFRRRVQPSSQSPINQLNRSEEEKTNRGNNSQYTGRVASKMNLNNYNLTVKIIKVKKLDQVKESVKSVDGGNVTIVDCTYLNNKDRELAYAFLSGASFSRNNNLITISNQIYLLTSVSFKVEKDDDEDEVEEKANADKENKNSVPKVVIDNHKYVKNFAKEDEAKDSKFQEEKSNAAKKDAFLKKMNQQD